MRPENKISWETNPFNLIKTEKNSAKKEEFINTATIKVLAESWLREKYNKMKLQQKLETKRLLRASFSDSLTSVLSEYNMKKFDQDHHKWLDSRESSIYINSLKEMITDMLQLWSLKWLVDAHLKSADISWFSKWDKKIADKLDTQSKLKFDSSSKNIAEQWVHLAWLT